MLETTTDASTPAGDQPKVPLRLTRLRREAAQLIKNQIKIGQAIRSQRIIYTRDLDEARGEKQEWVTRTIDLLNQLFSDQSVAEQCNDWVGPILPEFADFGLFVEQFTNEMKHRIARLQMLVKRLDAIPEPEVIKPSPSVSEKEKEEVRMLGLNNLTTPPPAPSAPKTSAPATSGLLVLRIAEEQTRQVVAQFFAALDLSLAVIDQRPAEGRKPLVESLTQHDRAAFALILNDAPTNDSEYLFDLGCCVGKFGAGRLCVLQRDGASPNADGRGVRHIALDTTGGWQLQLARHLKAGGVAIDLNRLV